MLVSRFRLVLLKGEALLVENGGLDSMVDQTETVCNG